MKQEEKLNSGITLGGKDTFTRVEQQSSAQGLQMGPADAAHELRMQQFKPRSLGRAEQLLVNPVAELFAHLMAPAQMLIIFALVQSLNDFSAPSWTLHQNEL